MSERRVRYRAALHLAWWLLGSLVVADRWIRPRSRRTSARRRTTLLNEALATTPPTDLRRLNREKLLKMGVAPAVAELLVDNTVLSPRHHTLLVGALETMSGPGDRAAFVRSAISTDTEDLALYRQRQAEFYAGYHRSVGPIDRFVAVSQLVVGRSRAGRSWWPCRSITWSGRRPLRGSPRRWMIGHAVWA